MGAIDKGSNWILTAVIAVFIVAMLLYRFQVATAQPGASAIYNTTIAAMFTLAWSGLGLFALALIIIPARILQSIATG